MPIGSSIVSRLSVSTRYLLLHFLLVVFVPAPPCWAQTQRWISKAMDAGVDAKLLERMQKVLKSDELIDQNQAQVIVDVLSALPIESMDDEDDDSPALALLELFERIEDEASDSPAQQVIRKEGLPLIIKIFDEKFSAVAKDGDSILLFKILRILALYKTLEGTDKIIEAARASFQPENGSWGSTFWIYLSDHPHRNRLIQSISKKIPEAGIDRKFLRFANELCFRDENADHAFDSKDGMRRLKIWLEENDLRQIGTPIDSAVALAFVNRPQRDELIELALNHPNPKVQIEAAWASAKHGQERGLKALQKYCLDLNLSSVARSYLDELQRGDLVPKEALDGAFAAMAEFSKWLAHPNELGKPPDEVVLVDHRKLRWPMEKEDADFYVIRFLSKDSTGLGKDRQDCGVVGSMTWCFFFLQMDQRPAEDVYAIHAAWEMSNQELINVIESEDPQQLQNLLNEWTGETLEEPRLFGSMKLSRRLKLGKRQPWLIEAKIRGERGWAVVDGPNSVWYPAAEQPERTGSSTILKIHIGRELLGFKTPVNRKDFLKPSAPIDKNRWLEKFHQVIEQAAMLSPEKQIELFEEIESPHFETYLSYAEEIQGKQKDSAILDVFPRLLDIVRRADEPLGKELMRSYRSPLVKYLPDYVLALVNSNRVTEAEEFLEFISPYMADRDGYALIGLSAYRAKLVDLAEFNLMRLVENDRSGKRNFDRYEEMESLVRIWLGKGKKDIARDLLLKCLKKSVEERQNPYDPEEDKWEIERLDELIGEYKKLFLELLPEEAEAIEQFNTTPKKPQ